MQHVCISIPDTTFWPWPAALQQLHPELAARPRAACRACSQKLVAHRSVLTQCMHQPARLNTSAYSKLASN